MDDKTVGDVMLPLEEYATIASDRTLQDALRALNKAQLGLTYDRHQHRAILALDSAGKVVGKLTHWAILRSLEPDLLQNGDLASLDRAGLSPQFLARLKRRTRGFGGSINRMCKVAARVCVADAMVPIGEGIAEEAPLSEAIQQFVLARVQSLLVLRKGTAVGILRLSDVFEEVADRIREE